MDGGRNLKNNFAGFNNDFKYAIMARKTESKVISICIAPVKVKHGDGIDMITTYAMLDNCSQGSFVHDNLIKELGVHGMKTTLNLKTSHGEKTESTMVVKGHKSLLSLPKLYTRKEIPIDKEEIATPAKIKE